MITLKTQNENFATAIGALASIAVLEEAIITPKPGLVDSCGTGAHTDMDLALLIRSASAIEPYWEAQALDGIMHGGFGSYDELFPKLRARGVEMESSMLNATGGVNTHKGIVFLLSLLLGAAGICLKEGDCSPAKICKRASDIVYPAMADELEQIKIRGADKKNERKLSNGEKIFLRHGVRGIRREAMDGFPSIVQSSLPAYENAIAGGAKGNDAALSALLELMSICEDTNIIHRAGFDFWRGEYKQKIYDAKKNFDPLEPLDYKVLLDLDKFLVERTASPGGAADLLVCTLFLSRSKINDNISMITRHVEKNEN
jgi:triphosphoribosyl-dephospho-CoA synthetase